MVKISKSVICLDIGNSTIHCGLYKNGLLEQEIRTETSVFIDNPRGILDNYDFFRYPLSYCSVVPKAEKALLNHVKKNRFRIFNLNHKSKGDFPINYPKQSQIGQDRLANSFAVFHLMKLPCIVIDFGTATTFDIVSSEGGYEGGIIVPGSQGFLDFLTQNTALLPKIKITKPSMNSLIGKETKEAMLIGAMLGHKFMIDGILKHLAHEIELSYNKKPVMVSTGGASSKYHSKNILQKNQLTLEGLAIAFELNNCT